MHEVRKLVKNHGDEWDFSFSVDHAISLYIPWIGKSHDSPNKKFTYVELLYMDKFKHKNPKYKLMLGDAGSIKLRQCIAPDTCKNTFIE